MPSPIHIRHDALKDSEARIRALTREVGTLREELRREAKRRERAVAQVRRSCRVTLLAHIPQRQFPAISLPCMNPIPMQAKQNEEVRTGTDVKVQELQYTNKKLASELASAHASQDAGSERNRRALRSLREGLAAVESAVAGRARQGKDLLERAFECLAKLKQQLFDSMRPDPAAAGALPHDGFEVQVTVILAEAVRVLSELEHVLVGPETSSGAGSYLQEGQEGQHHSPRTSSYKLERVSKLMGGTWCTGSATADRSVSSHCSYLPHRIPWRRRQPICAPRSSPSRPRPIRRRWRQQQQPLWPRVPPSWAITGTPALLLLLLLMSLFISDTML